MIVDTHCHLNDSAKFEDVANEIAMAHEHGVTRMIVVGVHPEEWADTVCLTEEHPELFCILGWHPNYTGKFNAKGMVELEKLARFEKCLAIGEIGLDYHWDFSPRETQRNALMSQLELAEALSMPVVFHAREAYSDLLDVLEQRPRRPYLLHCFAGNLEEAARAVELGCYFGIDGPITYKKSEDLRAAIASIPTDRLVVETDAPYLTPVPFRGKPNRPAYVSYVVTAVAELLGISQAECAKLTTHNAGEFFGQALIS